MDSRLLAAIRVLLLDVDGVLTDGRIVYDAQGGETKMFNVRDGLGLRLVQDAGIQVGIVTGRSSPALARRCEDLGITLLFDGCRDKPAVLPEIERRTGCGPAQMAYIGDDLPDIPMIRLVGCGIAVADAHPAVIAAADLVTRASGGHGAVREICERLLRDTGRWPQVMDGFR